MQRSTTLKDYLRNDSTITGMVMTVILPSAIAFDFVTIKYPSVSLIIFGVLVAGLAGYGLYRLTLFFKDSFDRKH